MSGSVLAVLRPTLSKFVVKSDSLTNLSNVGHTETLSKILLIFMTVLWPERLKKVQEAISNHPTKKGFDFCDLVTLEIEIREAAVENLRTHATYLAAGDRERYLSNLDSWFRQLVPDKENQ